MLGIISGTIFLQELNQFRSLKSMLKVNEYGQAQVFIADGLVFIPRHGIDPKQHILPHLINHQANLKVLFDVGATEVIGINSTGSLKKSQKPGSIVIPDDFLTLTGSPSLYSDKPIHVVPRLDPTVRKRCLEAAATCGLEAKDGGTYWQTTGPRLETKAEIKMMSHFADLVGMTMASEATIAVELGLSYASICSIDNYANGIGEKDLTPEEIYEQAQGASKSILRIISQYLTDFTTSR
jgi:5'-methylthioadenosine phosphorylase